MAKRRTIGRRIAIGAGLVGAGAAIAIGLRRGGGGRQDKGLLQSGGAIDKGLTAIGINLFGSPRPTSLPSFTQRDIRRGRVRRGGIAKTLSRAGARIRSLRILRDAGIIR